MNSETRAWVELTKMDDVPIWVNLATVETMRVHNNSTLLTFNQGGMTANISVKEQPRAILMQAGLA